jgi:hypothetical protein
METDAVHLRRNRGHVGGRYSCGKDRLVPIAECHIGDFDGIFAGWIHHDAPLGLRVRFENGQVQFYF